MLKFNTTVLGWLGLQKVKISQIPSMLPTAVWNPLKRRLLFMALLGALSGFAFAPFLGTPFLWISFPILIFGLSCAATWRQAFLTGCSFAFGQLIIGLYWITIALFVDIKQFWWLVPFSLIGIPLLFAPYYGLFLSLAWRVRERGASDVVLYALAWFCADYVRGIFLTGFPWNETGTVWYGVTSILQSVAFIGIHGLTLLTLVLVASPAFLYFIPHSGRLILAANLIILFTLIFLGTERLKATTTFQNDSYVRLVQPNIDQSLKWRKDRLESNFHQLMRLSQLPSQHVLTHILWPETASPYWLTEDEAHRNIVAASLPEHGLLLTGVIRADRSNQEVNPRFYNSLITLSPSSQILAVYDKHHLVPFGEYIPYRSILPVRALASLGIDFTEGPGPQSLPVEGLHLISPLICYEVIFSGEVARRDQRPSVLINITNDGWYRNSSGPYQHFEEARLRAIEEGLPLLRVANTGISAVIDPYGRVIKSLSLGQEGVIDSRVPTALPTTLFVRFGNTGTIVLFLILGIGIVVARFKGRS